ncbi:MAG: sodium/proline symporter PutP [Aureliella sp.]
MSWVAVSFAAYTLAIMVVGVWSAVGSRHAARHAGDDASGTDASGSEDFFLAGRSLGPWVAALSMAASAESGWVTLGLVGVAFTSGIGVFWLVLGTATAFWINWTWIAPALREQTADDASVTIPQFLASGTSAAVSLWIRRVSAAIIIVMLTTYVSAQFNASGKAFQETFGWSYLTSVCVGSVIVIAYTLVGGFRAVAMTDVAQAILMVAAVVILPIVMLSHIGGLGAAAEQIAALEAETISMDGKASDLAGGETMLSVVGGKSGWALVGFLSVWLGIPLGNLGQPHLLVRLMATRDEAAIRRARIISTVWVSVLFTGAIAVGLLARVQFGASVGDPERALPHAAIELLPAPLAGLMLAAVVAAMCSTADSQLLVAGSAFSVDLRARREGEARGLNRLVVLLVALVAAGMAAMESKTVFSLVLYAWDALGAAFGPAVLLKLLWKRTTGYGTLAGILTGATVAILWRETLHSQLYSLVPAFAFSLIAGVLVSLCARK